jgi:hypothetical protein
VLGAQVRGAHAHRSVDGLIEVPFKPGDFDRAVGMEQVTQAVPFTEVTVHPARDQVGDLKAVFQAVGYGKLSCGGCSEGPMIAPGPHNRK